MQLKTFSRRRYLLCCLLTFPLLAGCDILPSVSVSVNSQTPASTVNVWSTVTSGVQVRQEVWKAPDDPAVSDTVTIARFDLQNLKLTVAYQPDQPLSMQGWMEKEKPIALINGGYFDGLDHATALVIANNQAFGTSYQGFGGMLDVTAQGKVQLRSLHDQPYSSDEGLTQATQSSPMLVLDGARTQFSADEKASPRSVVAIDKQGRMLFIASPGVTFTLDQMAAMLAQSDLELTTALNLDGGSSTGLYVTGSQNVTIDSYTNLPLVIVVKKK